MSTDWSSWVTRWTAAGVIDAETADRIRTFEAQHAGSRRLGWPILVALTFGALMLAGGVLLFVAAHWDALSPLQRFSLVLVTVGGFHVAGALTADRFEGMSIALHAIGTVALGGGIALAGQIFNLEEHWPGGIMLWAAGAAVAFWLLRQIPQLVLTAILVPAWLSGECLVALHEGPASFRLVASGVFLTALTYFTAVGAQPMTIRRRALMWVGGVALVPAGIALAAIVDDPWRGAGTAVSRTLLSFASFAAFALPVAGSIALRRSAAWLNGVSAVWVVVLLLIDQADWNLALYAWWAAGAIGVVGWGVYEGRGERVNIGAAMFAATVMTFYFSSVMDKLGRSASLIGLGLLFLGGGWALERLRRRLVEAARAHA